MFLSRHEPRLSSVKVSETNEQVDGAYLLLDPNLCFEVPANGDSAATSSRSIIEVGVETALLEARFDTSKRLRRPGAGQWKTSATAGLAAAA